MANFANFIDEIKTQLENAGLTFVADPRISTLEKASRGNFDGSFLISSINGSQPFPEAHITPTHWRGELEIQIGTEIGNSAFEADKLVEERARIFFREVIYKQLVHGKVYGFSSPSKLRNQEDKRIIWAIRVQIRWTDDT